MMSNAISWTTIDQTAGLAKRRLFWCEHSPFDQVSESSNRYRRHMDSFVSLDGNLKIAAFKG